ncbi:hypothetical protein C8J57DRAFT_1055415 [Mycena rebaudengoi]|nr:hypothetical protein C8J57DRAFT_1055415 [Mycena rebaudengoi]
MTLNGWHRGENWIHQKLNTFGDFAVSTLWMSISGDLPGEHAQFHSKCLPFVPVTTLDDTGRPWGSILAAADGKPGFIQSPRYSTLTVDTKLWVGDPMVESSKLFVPGEPMLVAGIGIEFPTRRRNKFAGSITRIEQANNRTKFEFWVNQALGNCPKYINVRDLIPHPKTAPEIIQQKLKLTPDERLPDAAIAFILASDTVFIGTTYKAEAKDAQRFPSHLGMNQRGGRPGFIRVVPSDGRTVVLPDFSGNRFMTSLGNIEATPLASLTFVDFVSGDILYLTGDAENLVGPAAHDIMPLQKTLTTVFVTGYTLVRDALPVRQRSGTSPQRSPYSPPIRLLAEEARRSSLFDKSDQVTALLAKIEPHGPSIATFTWESSADIAITPGQAIIMDMSPLVGIPGYRHMNQSKPTSVNDDSIRTWTVSSSHSTSNTRSYSITIRHKPGGAVTGTLFAIAKKLSELKPEALSDSRPLELRVGIVGVTGDFTLPEVAKSISDDELGLTIPLAPRAGPPTKLLWVAGGIGITPFLSMLKAIRSVDPYNALEWDIRLVVSTREPDVLVPLIQAAAGKNVKDSPPINLALDVFTDKDVPELSENTILRRHMGRIPSDFFNSTVLNEKRLAYLCGPPEFEAAVLLALSEAGIRETEVKREGFEY